MLRASIINGGEVKKERKERGRRREKGKRKKRKRGARKRKKGNTASPFVAKGSFFHEMNYTNGNKLFKIFHFSSVYISVITSYLFY